MADKETLYANKVFMAAALPLMKTIATDVPELAKKFVGVDAVYQVSALVEDGKEAVHFTVVDGAWDVALGEYEGELQIDGELEFSSMERMNAFMKGDMLKLPKMKIKSFSKFMKFMQVLLKMSSLLGLADPEKIDEQTSVLLCKLYFYLLSSGISKLNKMDHESIHKWALESPDRCYQWEVIGHPECTAYLRVNKGKTKAGRGAYTRSKPFFNMKFDTPKSALMILLDTGDMFQMTAEQHLIMEGGPEFGVQIGDHMMAVGALAK